MTEPCANVVEQTVRISARPETVWRYWTDPRLICEWWGKAAELDPQPGGTFRVEMGGGPVMLGEYVQLTPFERLVFTFGWEPTDGAQLIGPGESRVEVTLMEDAGDTIMTLRHTGIPDAFAELHASGWSHFLADLATAANQATAPEFNS
ncbi:MAG: SRPBCC domain-containing protein [Ilumatobacteraceae bacterium]